MEFSEAYELNELLRFSPEHRSRKQPLFDTKRNAISLLETMMNCGFDLEEKFINSPQEFMPQEFKYHTEYTTEPMEPIKSEEKPQDPGPVVIQVTRDDNYRETYAQSLYKVSILTESLKTDITVKQPQGMSMLIYLFSTNDCIKINIPKKATVEQVIPRIIKSYLKDDKFKLKPLPFGPVAEAYEIRILDEMSFLPKLDYMLDPTSRIKDLYVNCLGFIVKKGYSDSSKVIIPMIKDESGNGKPIKVYYEKSCNVVQISEESTVKKLLEKLSLRYGYLNPDEFEFKVAVQVEELNEQECDISMDLKVSSLTTDELKLYRKIYADTPTMIETNKKEVPLLKEIDDVIYDRSRFNMTRAQASAYKEYEVIKTNAKGKRQKRILGINQLMLYNMTVKQAKDKLIKEKKTERGIMMQKFMSMLRPVTQHSQIPISQVHCVEQDLKNHSCLYIEYTEGGTKKRKLYETEKSSIAVEIISKIDKLISLVIFT